MFWRMCSACSVSTASEPCKVGWGCHLTIMLLSLHLPAWLSMAHVSAVCKRWTRVGQDPCFTKVVTGETINETISSARPGDTLELKPGFYQEIVLVEKPLKFVGQWSIDRRNNRKYKDVVLQSNRSMAVMCNARYAYLSLSLSAR